MLLPVRKLDSLSATERRQVIHRSGLDVAGVLRDTILPMLAEFEKDAAAALRAFSMKFDGAFPDPPVLDREAMKEAADRVAKTQAPALEAFRKAMANIRAFHRAQLPSDVTTGVGHNTLGLRFLPFDRVALYVPGGKALYPSTVMMGVIPAKLAGVSDITLLSPPGAGGLVPDIVQAIAWEAGATRILQCGGAQSIMAAAFGVDIGGVRIEPADFIYGPGNIFVAAAKSAVSGRGLCGIDSFAGPSEVLIIADESANPWWLAHDLLAQAEHDENATSILMCSSESLCRETSALLEKAVEERDSDRKAITREAMLRNGRIFQVRDLSEAIAFSNEFAPEHLEIFARDTDAVLEKIRAAGSVFCGDHAPVAVGDYFSGTNHILPTNRAARFASGISVHSFYRRITWQKVTREGLREACDPVSEMSRVEGLFDEHGYSVLSRFEEK